MPATVTKATNSKTEKQTEVQATFSILPIIMIALLIGVIIFMGSRG